MTRSERALIVGQALLLAASVMTAVALSEAADWDPVVLWVLLLVVAVTSEAFPLKTRSFHVSASFLAIVLAMVLMGPAPATALGVATVLISDAQRRSSLRSLFVNLTTYATFPLVGSVAFLAFDGAALLNSDPASYIVLVFALFVGTNLLNFALIAIDGVVREGDDLAHSIRFIYFPVLPVEIATGLLTAGVAYTYQDGQLSVIGLLAVVGMVFQYLLRTALSSMERKEQLEGRTRELAALQVGLLGTVLQTLSLRDKMTARHSAAVARYSREIARELGLNDRDQDVVHTAALLHDIGKFIFPDSILFADKKLSPSDFDTIRKHPEQGARLVARIDGYGPVAEIILAHHERMDGTGYPNGLVRSEIPLAARIISVADTYDVMTSRDSYRQPVSSAEAIKELRRVAGSQLDEGVVDAFIGLIQQRSVTFRHADDADFERELNLERRVRDYAAPRVRAA